MNAHLQLLETFKTFPEKRKKPAKPIQESSLPSLLLIQQKVKYQIPITTCINNLTKET